MIMMIMTFSQVRCEPYTRPGNKELFTSKKLKGEAKKMHTSDCVDLVQMYFDPILGAAFQFAYDKLDLNL